MPNSLSIHHSKSVPRWNEGKSCLAVGSYYTQKLNTLSMKCNSRINVLKIATTNVFAICTRSKRMRDGDWLERMGHCPPNIVGLSRSFVNMADEHPSSHRRVKGMRNCSCERTNTRNKIVCLVWIIWIWQAYRTTGFYFVFSVFNLNGARPRPVSRMKTCSLSLSLILVCINKICVCALPSCKTEELS